MRLGRSPLPALRVRPPGSLCPPCPPRAALRRRGHSDSAAKTIYGFWRFRNKLDRPAIGLPASATAASALPAWPRPRTVVMWGCLFSGNAVCLTAGALLSLITCRVRVCVCVACC